MIVNCTWICFQFLLKLNWYINNLRNICFITNRSLLHSSFAHQMSKSLSRPECETWTQCRLVLPYHAAQWKPSSFEHIAHENLSGWAIPFFQRYTALSCCLTCKPNISWIPLFTDGFRSVNHIPKNQYRHTSNSFTIITESGSFDFNNLSCLHNPPDIQCHW